MAVSNTPVFVKTPKAGVAQILPADTTTAKTVLTAGADGQKIVALLATSTDTAARTLQISLVRSAVVYLLGSVTVAIASGTDGTNPSVDLLSTGLIVGLPTDNDGQRYFYMESGDTLTVASTVAVTAAKVISLIAVAANF